MGRPAPVPRTKRDLRKVSHGYCLCWRRYRWLEFYGGGSVSAHVHNVREKLRPWALSRVESGRKFIVELKRDENALLTACCQFTAMFCNVEFYISFLPLLFWVEIKK